MYEKNLEILSFFLMPLCCQFIAVAVVTVAAVVTVVAVNAVAVTAAAVATVVLFLLRGRRFVLPLLFLRDAERVMT